LLWIKTCKSKMESRKKWASINPPKKIWSFKIFTIFNSDSTINIYIAYIDVVVCMKLNMTITCG
jgi:hypothetical protein